LIPKIGQRFVIGKLKDQTKTVRLNKLNLLDQNVCENIRERPTWHWLAYFHSLLQFSSLTEEPGRGRVQPDGCGTFRAAIPHTHTHTTPYKSEMCWGGGGISLTGLGSSFNVGKTSLKLTDATPWSKVFELSVHFSSMLMRHKAHNLFLLFLYWNYYLCTIIIASYNYCVYIIIRSNYNCWWQEEHPDVKPRATAMITTWLVGLTVQPVQAWKKGRYKLFDWFWLI